MFPRSEALSGALLAVPALHQERIPFADLPAFLQFVQIHHHRWPEAVQRSLRLIALNGILDPISGDRVPAEALEVAGSNFRETLSHQGCLARHRAVLLEVAQLMASGQLPPREALELYCPELLTPFAQQLRRLFPKAMCSEFMPDPADPRRASLPHQDLCALTFSQASFDLVLCNEIFEHLYDLPAALREIARVLRPGGWLVSTCPLAYSQQEAIVKARHRPGAVPGVAEQVELLTDPEFHGNPINPEQGSLVYQIPGWDLLDQARTAGFAHACFHWVAAPSYGVLGQEIPAVIVLLAQVPL